MLKEIPQELISFIDKYSTFFILGHEEPDGDCLGSQTGLADLIYNLGKKAALCSPGPFIRPESMAMMSMFSASIAEAAEKAGKDISNPDVKAECAVIITDCSTPDRIGAGFAEEIKEYPVAVIDHHASGRPFGDVSYVEGKSPSTTVLVYKLMKELGCKPQETAAEDLLFGFITDTGYFRHLDATETDSEAMLLAAELLAYGASPKKLFYRMYGGRPLESKILTGRILSRAESFLDGRCIFIYETLEEKNKYGSKNRDSDTINSQLFGVKGCEAIIFVREEEDDKCSVSLRSLEDLDVGAVAASFGGGGHKRAAGFEWKGSRSDAEAELRKVFTELMS